MDGQKKERRSVDDKDSGWTRADDNKLKWRSIMPQEIFNACIRGNAINSSRGSSAEQDEY